jgi:hypothetical protein
MAWPTIANPSGCTETVKFPQVRTEFENGAVQSRPKWTAVKRAWHLSWGQMTAAHYALLAAHFATYQGTVFSWTHPLGTTYSVRYSGDELQSDILTNTNRRLDVAIEEA